MALPLLPSERLQLEQWVAAHGTPQQVALRCQIVLAAAASQPPDLVKGNFRAPAPNRLRVVDITYVPIWSGGFAYVAFVIDAFSRMITGWKAAGDMRTSLAPGLLTWSENWCEVCGLEEPQDEARPSRFPCSQS